MRGDSPITTIANLGSNLVSCCCESMCSSLRSKSSVLAAQAARLVAAGSKSVLVATNDQCIRDCLSGAFFVSSALLLKEVTKVQVDSIPKHEQMSNLRGREPDVLHAARVRFAQELRQLRVSTCSTVDCRWRRKRVDMSRLRCS